MSGNVEEGHGRSILAIFVVAILLSSLTRLEPLIALDESLFLSVNEILGSIGEATSVKWFTELGSFYTVMALSFLVWASGHRRLGIALMLAVLAASALGATLKLAVARPRPFEVFDHLPQLNEFLRQSFPSGHTLLSFTVAGVLIERGHRWAPLALGLAAAIGVSRLLMGAHFPFDVASGALLGIMIGVTVSSFNHERGESLSEDGR